MRKLKSIASLLLLFAVVVFAAQNSTTVEIRFLLWSFNTPRAVLVVALLAVGFILGLLISSLSRRKRRD